MKSEERWVTEDTQLWCSRGLILVVSEGADAKLEEQEVHGVLQETHTEHQQIITEPNDKITVNQDHPVLRNVC